MKPLYVQGAETLVEQDGPALKICGTGQAERWFPLRRISQVVSADRVEWTTQALLACAEAGITISFLAEDGTVLARVLGKPGERTELPQRFADFLLRPDWRDLYEQWLTAMERMAVRSVSRRAGAVLELSPSARELRRMFREAALGMNALFAYERIGREVHSLLVALATRQLVEAGFGADGRDPLEPDLATGLASILFWDFQLARMAWLEDRLREDCVEAPDRRSIVAFFEARRARTERLAAGLVNRLHRWLIELG